MTIIDIDRLEIMESHIHYLKEYKGSLVFMDKKHSIHRSKIEFSIEYKALQDPTITVTFTDELPFPVDQLVPKIEKKIRDLDGRGTLAAL
jgi:hypothetical protein